MLIVDQRRVFFLLVTLLLGGHLAPLLAAEPPIAWWEQETNLADDGSLDLSQKPWWPRALALKPGESLALSSELSGGGRMLIRCETLGQHTQGPREALVWILDDDGDMRPDDRDGDKDSDCYVVDYQRDGTVDRMVDYLDADADGQADEMDIRCFVKGQLETLWVGVDLDRDGQMWDLRDYSYPGDFFRCDPHGNNLIYANKYDPEQRRWWPISECPFAFYGTRGTGRSDRVVRISAVPVPFDLATEPDLGNSAFWMPFSPRMRNIGAVNVRYSVDLDGQSSPERPLHYECGFNLIGRVPYDFPGMARENPLRRAPKTTCCIPTDAALALAETYPAEQTGFSWREFGDPLCKIGDQPYPGECRRWEGVFWTWNRRIMHDTGGPVQDWNTRREFRGTPSTQRELYYCRADRRIHLKGATEGWTQVGHLASKDTWGEFRMFDTNGDGYFDRWETYRSGTPVPVRVSTPTDAGVRDLPRDWNALTELYTRELLPEALQANQELMAAMDQVAPFTPPAELTKALGQATCDSEKCYLLDVLRETQYLALRAELYQRSARQLAADTSADTRRSAELQRSSEAAWDYAAALSRLDAAYGEGRYHEATELLHKLAAQQTTPAETKATETKTAAAGEANPFQGAWYQCGTAANAYPGQPCVYSGPDATYSAWHRPMALHVPSQAKTFFVFGNAKNSPAISFYDHAAKAFADPVVLGQNPDDDAHRNPTLLIDEQGYLYVFYGAHGHPTQVTKSAAPYRIDQWRKVGSLDNPRTCYPQPWQLRAGELFVSFRETQDYPNGTWSLRRSIDGGATWQPTEAFLRFAGCSIYAITVAETGDYPRKVHIAWSRLGGGTPEEVAAKHLWARRYNVYYACSEDAGHTWKRSDGSVYRLPIDEAQAERIYDSGEHGVWLKDLQLDPQGKPLILFIDSECRTYQGQWKVAQLAAGQWRIAELTPSDHMYDDGALVVHNAQDYRIYAPTGVSQPHEDGGEIEEWQSTDGGRGWKRLRALTSGSRFSHNNVKAVLQGTPEFRVFWSYGDSLSPPRSRAVDLFYFGEAMHEPRPITVGAAP